MENVDEVCQFNNRLQSVTLSANRGPRKLIDRVIRCKLLLNWHNSSTEDFDIADLARLQDLEGLVYLLLPAVRADLSDHDIQLDRLVRETLESLESRYRP